MLTRHEIADHLRKNPLPKHCSSYSSLIQGLFYYYGIDCQADEALAGSLWLEGPPIERSTAKNDIYSAGRSVLKKFSVYPYFIIRQETVPLRTISCIF